jgi:hypothetical protein
MDTEKVEFDEIEDKVDTKIIVDDDSDDSSFVYVKSEAEKKFVRKLNNNILPLIFFIILCQVKRHIQKSNTILIICI